MFGSLLYSDPLSYAPGTRASAVGGAFTAISNNSSASYYNPAGLAAQGFQAMYITIEGGGATKYDYKKQEFVDDGGGAFDLTVISNRFGLEFSWYSTGFDQDIMSLSCAYGIMEGMSIGLTAGMATTYATEESIEWFYGLGYKANILNLKQFPVKLDFGISYRSEQSFEELKNNSQSTYSGYGMPSRAALGVALLLPTKYAAVTISADYVYYGYTSATDYQDVVVKMKDINEMKIGLSTAFNKVFMGIGYNTSSSEDNNFNLDVMSIGSGIQWEGKSKGWISSIDVTYEKRSGNYIDNDIDQSSIMFSINLGHMNSQPWQD